MLVDLHIHTNASDGVWNRNEVVENVIKAGIGFFSITDHNTIENSKIMAREIRNYGYDLKYLVGAEVSCTYNDREHHITAYAFDPDNADLNNLLHFNEKALLDFNDRTIRWLIDNGTDIDNGEFLDYKYDRRKGGWKALNFLLDKGIIENVDDYFNIVKGLDFKVVFNDPATVINIIKKADGVPFLAHPNAYYGGGRMPERDMKKWIDFGIAGFECYSPYCAREDSEEYVRFCNKNRMLISGGSDCHGSFVSSRKLGFPRITLDMLNLDGLLDRAIIC